MKLGLMTGIVSLMLTSTAFAHCGHCGKEAQGHAEGGAQIHAGAQCPMHGEKNAVLLEAAKALETSNPDLAGKLNAMAASCCGGH